MSMKSQIFLREVSIAGGYKGEKWTRINSFLDRDSNPSTTNSHMSDAKPSAKKAAAKTETKPKAGAKPKVEKKAAATKTEAKPKVEKKKAAAKTEAKPKAETKPVTPVATGTPTADATATAKKPAGKAAPKAAAKGVAKKTLKAKAAAKGRQGKKQTKKFTVDCSNPVEDGIMDAANFEKFLHDRIKVNGKAGNLGDVVTISRDKSKITVTTDLALSKRYLKYLTKKFLKAKKLRDWLHVIAVNKTTYELRYFNIEEAEESQPATE